MKRLYLLLLWSQAAGCWLAPIRLHDPMPGASELDLRAKSSLKYPTTE